MGESKAREKDHRPARRKILFVDHTPFVGGAQLALIRHLKYLDGKEFSPLVACSNKTPGLKKAFEETGAKVFEIPFGKLKTLNPLAVFRFLSTFFALLFLIRRRKVDLVVTNTERAAYAATLAALLTKRPIVWIVRDFDYPRLLFRSVFKLASAIVFVAEAVKSFYFGRGKDFRFRVVYVGSDFYKLLESVTAGEVADRRRRWGVDGRRFVIGFVGRLVSWKGAQVLLGAGRIMKESGFDVGGWKIIIVGSGGDQKGSNEESLRQMAKAARLEDDVVFMGFRKDIPLCLKSFKVFVHPSIKPEPFATVVVEAMMAALPVVASNLGGTREIIKDGETGLLFPAGDEQALARILMRLMRDFSLRSSLGERARKQVMENFKEETITSKLEAVYREVFARAVKPAKNETS